MYEKKLKEIEDRNSLLNQDWEIEDIKLHKKLTELSKKTAEEWLNENVKLDDWNKLEESLNDALWTNNVIKYMEEYLKYKLEI